MDDAPSLRSARYRRGTLVEYTQRNNVRNMSTTLLSPLRVGREVVSFVTNRTVARLSQDNDASSRWCTEKHSSLPEA